MIVYKNVCDYCANEETITENSIGFGINFSVLSVYKQAVKGQWHNTDNKMTFCRRDCLIEWLKDNMRPDGTFSGDKVEGK